MPLRLNRDLLQKGVYKSDKTFTVRVKLLDNTIVNLTLPQKAKGRECLEKIAQSLGLEEVCWTNFHNILYVLYLFKPLFCYCLIMDIILYSNQQIRNHKRYFLYKHNFTWMSKVEIWTLRSFLLIEQLPGPSSLCDHIS